MVFRTFDIGSSVWFEEEPVVDKECLHRVALFRISYASLKVKTELVVAVSDIRHIFARVLNFFAR